MQEINDKSRTKVEAVVPGGHQPFKPESSALLFPKLFHLLSDLSLSVSAPSLLLVHLFTSAWPTWLGHKPDQCGCRCCQLWVNIVASLILG